MLILVWMVELINEIYHRFYADRYPNRIDFSKSSLL